MSEEAIESKSKSKSKTLNALDPKAEAAANVLTRFRAFGMLVALGAGAWSGFQAAQTSDLFNGAIRAATVWGLVAGAVMVGSKLMGMIIEMTPPDATEPETESLETAKQ